MYQIHFWFVLACSIGLYRKMPVGGQTAIDLYCGRVNHNINLAIKTQLLGKLAVDQKNLKLVVVITLIISIVQKSLLP